MGGCADSALLGGLRRFEIGTGFRHQIGEALPGLGQAMANALEQSGGTIGDTDSQLQALLGEAATGGADGIGKGVFTPGDRGHNRGDGDEGSPEAHGKKRLELKHGWLWCESIWLGSTYRLVLQLSASAATMPAPFHLQIAHQLPERVRLQWGADSDAPLVSQLADQLPGQPWLGSWQLRPSSRSLILELQVDCPAVRWQLALAELGCQLHGPELRDAVAASVQTNPWALHTREIGGNLMGAAIGQVLIGGGAAALGAAVAGPGTAVVLGGLGSVLGAVIGSIVGVTLADGHPEEVADNLEQLTWKKLNKRMGEEAGSDAGMALGAAIAGPLGAVTGMAVGSLLGGQLATDLSKPDGLRATLGSRHWVVGMMRDSTAESLSERLAAQIGAHLTGGSESGRQLAGSLGLHVSRHIDWDASLHRHRLVSHQSRPQADGPSKLEPSKAPLASMAPSHSISPWRRV